LPQSSRYPILFPDPTANFTAHRAAPAQHAEEAPSIQRDVPQHAADHQYPLWGLNPYLTHVEEVQCDFTAIIGSSIIFPIPSGNANTELGRVACGDEDDPDEDVHVSVGVFAQG
jgi:hypothetical protein